MQDAPLIYSGSDLQQRVMRQTGVHLVELVDAEDQRASQCPTGQRILRVAGGRDQVGKIVVAWLCLRPARALALARSNNAGMCPDIVFLDRIRVDAGFM